jgi:hypothetical protein
VGVVWLVLRRGPLETSEGRSPKFHTIQLVVQAIQSFDQIVNNCIFGRLRHRCFASILGRTIPHSGSRSWPAFWFPLAVIMRLTCAGRGTRLAPPND